MYNRFKVNGTKPLDTNNSCTRTKILKSKYTNERKQCKKKPLVNQKF